MLKHLLISGEEDSLLKFMEFMGGIDPESDKGKYFYKNKMKFAGKLRATDGDKFCQEAVAF